MTTSTAAVGRRGAYRTHAHAVHVLRAAALTLVLALAALLLCACGGVGRAAAVPIEYGRRDCDYCRMTISDPRYGAELVTTTGRVHPFDSIECLAGYYAQLPDRSSVRALWVSDYAHPGHFVRADGARYVRAAGAGSPMGKGLRAYASAADAGSANAGEPLDWEQVVASVSREAMPRGAAADTTDAVPAPVRGVATTIEVSPTGAVRTVGEAIRRAPAGATIVVRAGVYREPTVVVDRPVTIVGDHLPVLDGEGQREIMRVTADDVTVRGLRFRNVGASFTEDRAAIRLADVHDCTVEGNRVDDGFFGIYLARVSRCRVVGNVLRAAQTSESLSGNGIHLWYSSDVTIADNRVSGHRDGIYFEFVRDGDVRRNVSEGNLRYGLHFMYSDGCRYVENTFRRNGSGVAVMYTKDVEMTGNDFDANWGAAAYGLLLKEITDVRVRRNRFRGNTTALFLDGATRPVVEANEFTGNGRAVRLDANTQDGRFAGNDFGGNTFDVTTNARTVSSIFDGNFWDEYGGYDLNRDGVGDVPFRPVRLFSIIVERNEPALVLLRSFFVGALDAAERVVPSLTPEMLADAHPSMRPLHPWHPSR